MNGRTDEPVKGAVAQLGERLICIQEAAGSIPTSSTSILWAPRAKACRSAINVTVRSVRSPIGDSNLPRPAKHRNTETSHRTSDGFFL